MVKICGCTVYIVCLLCCVVNAVITAVDECAVSNGGCQHICVRSPVGHHCECSHGYKLDYDHKSCLGTYCTIIRLVMVFTASGYMSYCANLFTVEN